jgi:CubicO group peptidase (beta-lactamase class C family)
LSYIASVRKSVLSMLYGPQVASGRIRLDATLKDLGRSDVGCETHGSLDPRHGAPGTFNATARTMARPPDHPF